MKIDYEIVLSAAFAAIGLLEYVKGFFPSATPLVWRALMPVVCLTLAGFMALLPQWVTTGILALALSQVGYELIIQSVKSRIGGPR